jgi:hypothetical protein
MVPGLQVLGDAHARHLARGGSRPCSPGERARCSIPEAAGLGIRRAGDRDAADVDDELVRRLQEHLDEAQLIELTMIVCLENVRSRFTSALGIAPHRFKDRCEMPQLEELEGG